MNRSHREHRHDNLPTQRTRLIGREDDVAVVRQIALDTHGHIVTLTGTGGCGKTRLALRVAAELVGAFRDGVWLVELAPLSDASLVPQAVAAVLGVGEQPGRPILDALVASLKRRQLMLVLDNCEHLVEVCAYLVHAILNDCTGVRLLATSREPLRVQGEITWRVPSLAIPDLQRDYSLDELAQISSVQLFRERAQAARRDFELTPQNRDAVAQVCARLDGLPLAIELAAVRLRAFGVEQLRERLDVLLLGNGNRTSPSRQRTLEATLNWSHMLLTESEQVVFRRLAVFAGGWSLEAAEAVCAGEPVDRGDVLEVLVQLVDKSLVTTEDRNGRARYRLLEPVLQYADARLTESSELSAVQRRHASFFLTFAEQWETDANVGGPRRQAAHAALSEEQDNLRAALRWSLNNGEADVGLRLGKAHTHFWLFQSRYHEGRSWLMQLLALPGATEPTASRAAVLIVTGIFASRLGDYGSARPLYEEALPIARRAGDPWLLFSTLVNLAWDAEARGDYVAAQVCLDEALVTTRAARERVSEAMALGRLGWLACQQGDYALARARCEEGLAAARAVGDSHNVSVVLNMLGYAILLQGDAATARSVLEESLAVRRQEGERWGTAWALDGLGLAMTAEGRHVEAQTLLAESLGLRYELGDQVGTAESLESIATLAAAQAHPEHAMRLAGAAQAIRETVGAPLSPMRRAILDHWRALLPRAFDEGTTHPAWVMGRAMLLERAVALARGGAEPLPTRPNQPHTSSEVQAGPLTRREREVATLIARGLSNRQIAERLVITDRTVAAHVEHILDKLGFTSRTQIGVWASEQGLVASSFA